MTFEVMLPRRVRFGPGVAGEVADGLSGLSRVLAVTGGNPDRHPAVWESLRKAGLSRVIVQAAREPTVDDARMAVEIARREGCQGVVALGGGSALDLGKAVAGLLANPGDPMDYLEVVGRGKTLDHLAVPLVAIPTTAGTGSEVTRNAVLVVPERGVKASLRSPHLLPTLALVDPDLTRSMSPEVTAWCGMDALVQLIEPFFSSRAHPFTDALCREAIPRALRALPRSYRDGADREARQEMALISLFGGMALANSGLGAAHGLAAAIGGRFPAPHGALCARLIVPVMATNYRRAMELGRQDLLGRFHEMACWLTGDPGASIEEGMGVLEALVDALGIPRLSAWGLTVADLPDLARAGSRAGSTKGNPVPLPEEDLEAVLTRCL